MANLVGSDAFPEAWFPEVSHCMTCSDAANRGRVLRITRDGMAVVDVGSATEGVSLELVEAGSGDIVLVHAKVAIARLGSIDPNSGDPYRHDTRGRISGPREEENGGN